MHAYDVSRRYSLPSLPSSRSAAQEPFSGPSVTPIYDALYAEYVKSFRSLPGDRSGEDELGFTAFGNIPHGSGSFRDSYSAYSAGAYSARQQSQQWQRVGQMRHVPAALPPGPRQGF
ncbi:hypothetical protein [Streptomyces sp. YU58]|uniref:hypothetical protein n=1 Tax=Streptomyces sp. SX92 TaxID=3158972 RepID=UPI0027BAB58D|nr:hypothetical protein [Streptomyces coralus]WLW56148.1 hypothetical protein QU709_34510 [Streptomyces coralus]